MASQVSHTEGPAKSGESRIGKASSTRLVLTPADIRELYEAARSLAGMGGSPYLNRLFDAQTALGGGQLDRVQKILSMTRSEFEKSHFRLLRYHPGEGGDARKMRDEARLAARKEELEETLRQFDEYLAVLGRMAEVAARAAAKDEPPKPPPSAKIEPPALPAGLAEAFRGAGTTEEQFSVLSRYFVHAAVESAGNVHPRSLYFLRTRSTGHLLWTAPEPVGAEVPLTDALTGRPVRAQQVEALVAQGQKGKFFALAERAEREEPVTSEPDGAAEAAEVPSVDPLEAQNTLLDRQLFNVLMTAVKHSGLGISTELIVQVRDNEFRKGEYLDAFEKLNQLSTRYEVAAARRKEELRRHDQWLASGQSGLSLREVEEAKLKNAQERTRLEHGSHRFGLVVEPLRILARS